MSFKTCLQSIPFDKYKIYTLKTVFNSVKFDILVKNVQILGDKIWRENKMSALMMSDMFAIE